MTTGASAARRACRRARATRANGGCGASCGRAPLSLTCSRLAQDVRTADWSEEVAPFWGAVIRSALSAQGFAGLFKAGWTTIKAWLHPPRTHPD